MSLAWLVPLLLEVIVFGVFAAFLAKSYTFLKKYYTVYKAASQFPSLPRHWLMGTLPTLRYYGQENFPNYLVDQVKRFGSKAVVFWRGSLLPEIMVTHAQTIGEILKTSEPKNRRLKGGYTLLEPWLGDGLLISSGKKWARNRRLLTPAFHFNVLQPYIKVYNDAADILINKMQKEAVKKESFEVFGPMALCTLDVMLRCAFSYEGNVQEIGSTHPYVKAVERIASIQRERGLKPHLYFDWLYNRTAAGKEFNRLCDYVHSFADEIIEARKSALIKTPDVARKRYLDFLDILLAARDENGAALSKEDVRAEVDTFLFEGHDTTASTTSWALYALAKYPDIQDKVFQEVHEILADKPEVEWESMRMYTPVPTIGRQLTKPVVIDGKELPAGMVVIASIRAMHHNPEVWEKPEEFRPERFGDKNESRDPYSFTPFSAGPRNCIGQNFAMNEEKVILARVIKRFRLILDEDHPIVEYPSLVLRAKHGLKVKLVPRD